MRVASSTFYQLGLSAMNNQQGSLLHVQQQLGTGRRVLTPSDDPVAATRALGVAQAGAVNGQYAASRKQANINLSLEENALQSVTTTLQNVQSQIVQAGNGTMSDADRASLATTLQTSYNQLLGLANSDDGNGHFLFAGFKSGSPPFSTGTGGQVQYNGDNGTQLMQVDVARQMPVSDDGQSVFQSVQSSASYVTSANTNNRGTATFSATTVTDPSNPQYGHKLSVNFAVDPVTSATTYTVTDLTANPPTTGPATAYTPGSAIQVAGLSFAVSGVPADTDSIQLSPASQAGTDVFASLKAAIDTLNKPINTTADSAALTNVLSTTNRKMSNALDNVLTVRSSVGARMQELDALDTIGTNKGLNYTQTLSGLQDLDYPAAITEYYQRQTSLQAAQQSFMQIQNMNLFNFLK